MKTRMRRALPYAPFAAIAIIGVVLLAVVVWRLASGPAAPLQYTRTDYTSERSVYAPGDTIAYTASLTIRRYGELTVTRGFRTRPQAGRARLCDGTNAPTLIEAVPPFPQDAVGIEVEGKVTVVVPKLPPGDYWLVSSVRKADGGESVTKVAFSVAKSCDDG